MNNKSETQHHNIPPVFDENSKVLILGSFPSVKSREQQFFYGHKQNRFWKVTSIVLNDNEPVTVDEKISFLLRNNIALWDVIKSCDIKGSSDSSIQNIVPNDLKIILDTAKITAIFCNGSLSYKLYNKFILPKTGIEAVLLPSTSPANAVYSLDKLLAQWKKIKKT